jgi:hypothetical protein
MGNHPTKQHGKIKSSSRKNVHWKTAGEFGIFITDFSLFQIAFPSENGVLF